MASGHVFPPGEILREELEERGWSQADLAEILGRPAKLVNEIIAGKRSISPETAQGLADALGTSPDLWMNLESQYQLNRTQRGDNAVVRRAAMFELAPIKEMQRRGWIPNTKDVEQLEVSLCAFFGTRTLDDIRTQPHVAKKSTSYDAEATPAQRAWVQRVRQIGESVNASPFSENSFRDCIGRLRTLLRDRAEIRRVPRILADGGVRLVIVEPLEGTRIDGVCVWLTPSQPVIAVSLRFDRVDSFWFTLAHECGHVLRRDGIVNPIVDLDLVGDNAIASKDKPEAERLADEFASNFLIPENEMANFQARVKPLYSKDRIRGFAARLEIHPGIVVGQLAFRKQIGYWHSREMLEKVRDVVTSAALSDGWGHSLG
jgi:HTH-type transcriptional regulator/antitoxin HigA